MATAARTRRQAVSRATLRYVRSSASKARPLLDGIRGESYERASEVLEFSERRIAGKVLQALRSASANAEHNRQMSTEDLFVQECYADEGTTIKRWRPRARGRATPIMKRTCHITVVLGRYDAEERAERASKTTAAQEARRRRVEASRAAAEQRELEEAEVADEVPDEGSDVEGAIGAQQEQAPKPPPKARKPLQRGKRAGRNE